MTEIKELSTKHHRHQGPGPVKQYHNIKNGLLVEAENASARVQWYAPGVVRVQIAEGSQFDDVPYAVIYQPEEIPHQVEDLDSSIRMLSDKLQVEIDREMMRFTFKTPAGEVVNEDLEGFGVSFMGDDKSVYKKIQEGERFIGLGEKTGNLDRRGMGYTNWNTDSFAYGPHSDPLYCSFPFYLGIHHHMAYGLFLDNTYKSHFNFGASNNRFASFTVEGGELDYYFIYEDSVVEIIKAYTLLTGRMELPPLWSLGYQQCRYSYYPQEEVYQVARTFREKKIPADAIVLDIHYMEAYKIFTWDEERFPDPGKMISDLREKGFQVVVMCDPGIKVEQGYTAYEDGLEQDVFIKYPDGTYYQGEVWPGWCHFPDFTDPDTREWWGKHFQDYVSLGVKGFWNDMNEIATWGQRLPDLMEFYFEGHGGSTKRARNIYGLNMCRATFEGTKHLLKGERPFILTRAGYCGIQRYSAVWTGDNVATDEHMLLGVRLVNSLGLSGVSFTGYDIGGFAGDTSVNLFARWISLGAFSPFFRGHTMVNSRDSEPWSFGEEVEDISRNYINLRYRLLPYIYSTFYQSHINGLPLCRSLAIDYTFDDLIYQTGYQNQYLFGPHFLVAPVESYKDLTKVYLPQGQWYDFHQDKVFKGEQEIYVECPLTHLPLFVKAGAIIPMQSQVQSVMESPEPVLHLHLYYGDHGIFEYYEDDGSSYHYQEDEYYIRQFKLEHNKRRIVLTEVNGSWNTKFDKVKFYLHGFEELDRVVVNGDAQSVTSEEVTFLPPISNFDPVQQPHTGDRVETQAFIIDNADQEIVVEF